MTGVCEACRTRPTTAVILAGIQLDGVAELVGLCGTCLDTAGALVVPVVQGDLGGRGVAGRTGGVVTTC